MTTDDHARAPGIPIDRLDDLAMLGSLAAFADDGAEALGELASTVSRFRRPAKHEVVREGEVADGLYVVLRGRVHLTRTLPGGREIILGSLGPGEMFGETSVAGTLSATSTAVTALPSELARIPQEAAMRHVLRHPASMRGLMCTLARRMADVEAVASDLALCDVESRLRRTLVQLARRQGRPALEDEGWVLAPVPTQTELARMVGSCRETVSRTLTAMARAGELMTRGRRMTVGSALMARYPQA